MSLAILGGTVVDVIFPRVGHLPQWPRHTEFTSTNLVLLNTPPLVTLGGNGANAAYVAARCGADVTLHTRIGADSFGNIAASWLQSAGCALRPTTRQGATAINVTAANARHERATFFYAGEPATLPRYAANAVAPRALLVCGWPHPPVKAMAATFKSLRARGTLTALDIGPLLSQKWATADLAPVFAHLDLLLANAHEAAQLTKSSGKISAAIHALRMHHAGHIVIKNGSKGAWWVPAGETKAVHFPAKRVRVINTVGAGDSFNGALLAALVKKTDFAAALKTAAKVAASVVSSKSGVLGVRP
ncbi:carbohydrate kinase family protein [Oleiharenicola lentus]|uniref:carbohydrate kinase family protein n=1 Tax=Oleiharenicola lentus TaxID=2508720 RepID=UPI003F6630C8